MKSLVGPHRGLAADWPAVKPLLRPGRPCLQPALHQVGAPPQPSVIRRCLPPTSPQDPAAQPSIVLEPASAPSHELAQGQPQGAESGDPQAVSLPNASQSPVASTSDIESNSKATGRRPRTRSIFTWPPTRHLTERPPFLEGYPAAKQSAFNINSFLGPFDIHGGKYHVPADQYQQFLTQYHAAFCDGYQLFLTEVYGTRPFRYFLELDFDWETAESAVKRAFYTLFPILRQTIQSHYKLQKLPLIHVSMRTAYKVHINCPNLVTTELQAMQCRERIIEECKKCTKNHMSSCDWDKVIDFPHGSFRLLGSRKPKKLLIGKEPSWVHDKAYYPVEFSNGKGWQPTPLTLDRLLASSIIPTPRQVQIFESSPAYLNIIFEDMSAFQEQLLQRHERRLAQHKERLARIAAGDLGLEDEYQQEGGQAQGGQTHGGQSQGSQAQGDVTQGQEDQGGQGRAQFSSQQPARDSGTTAAAAGQAQGRVGGDVGGAAPDSSLAHKMKHGVQIRALKQQQNTALRMLAKRSGEVGQAFLEAAQQLELLVASLKASQSEQSMTVNVHRVQVAQGVEVSSEAVAALADLTDKVKGLQRQIAQQRIRVDELAEQLVVARNELPRELERPGSPAGNGVTATPAAAEQQVAAGDALMQQGLGSGGGTVSV